MGKNSENGTADEDHTFALITSFLPLHRFGTCLRNPLPRSPRKFWPCSLSSVSSSPPSSLLLTLFPSFPRDTNPLSSLKVVSWPGSPSSFWLAWFLHRARLIIFYFSEPKFSNISFLQCAFAKKFMNFVDLLAILPYFVSLAFQR